MSTPLQSGRGGKRAGAGRKALPEKRHNRSYQASHAELEAIETVLADTLGMSPPQAMLALARGEWIPVKVENS